MLCAAVNWHLQAAVPSYRNLESKTIRERGRDLLHRRRDSGTGRATVAVKTGAIANAVVCRSIDLCFASRGRNPTEVVCVP